MAIETPKLTVDVVVRCSAEHQADPPIALIERRNPPTGLALPGGFVDVGEPVERAAIREMREELSADVCLDYLLGVYSQPDRDPRGHTVSVVYAGSTAQTPRAASDAKEVHLVSADALPLDRLVFDHARILADFLETPGPGPTVLRPHPRD